MENEHDYRDCSPEECIEKAIECDKMGAATDDPKARQTFIDTAISWRHLASLIIALREQA
jgi:hypothetical protein